MTVIFLYSIFHSGTIFMQDLLASDPGIQFGLDINGSGTRESLNFLLWDLVEGKTDRGQFEKAIQSLMIDPQEPQETPMPPYLILGCHILPRGYGHSVWPMDVFDAGHQFPIVTPIRHPVRVLVSMLLRAGDGTERGVGMKADEIVDYLVGAYTYLPELEEKHGAIVVPVDLLEESNVVERKIAIQGMFQKLTGRQYMGQDTLSRVYGWHRRNVTTSQRYGKFEDPLQAERLLQAIWKRGNGLESLPIVDAFLDRLGKQEGAMAFLVRHGYEMGEMT
jgi:hypothetical protein